MNVGDEFKLVISDENYCSITNMVVTGVIDNSGINQYSLKDDERFKSADDIEETHVKTTDW